jgi:hypothetical protein
MTLNYSLATGHFTFTSGLFRTTVAALSHPTWPLRLFHPFSPMAAVTNQMTTNTRAFYVTNSAGEYLLMFQDSPPAVGTRMVERYAGDDLFKWVESPDGPWEVTDSRPPWAPRAHTADRPHTSLLAFLTHLHTHWPAKLKGFRKVVLVDWLSDEHSVSGGIGVTPDDILDHWITVANVIIDYGEACGLFRRRPSGTINIVGSVKHALDTLYSKVSEWPSDCCDNQDTGYSCWCKNCGALYQPTTKGTK